MQTNEFRAYAHQFVDWMADYIENIEQYPVKSQVNPRQIFNQLPDNPPETGESMADIMDDFRQVILPGITHWQSPNFFAYFPANSSYPSVLAEMLTATLGTQCMIWETSPAAAELEEKMMNWLIKMLGLPDHLEGVIQDTASTATLAAILTAREKYSNYRINQSGFTSNFRLKVYCSSETHSSIEKAVKIAGFGRENLVKIEVDSEFKMQADQLAEKIKKDIDEGNKPVCVVATMGTTSTTAIDPLREIGEVCKKYDVWLHVDAAYAGTALILPEYRWMLEGIENVDSFVFNPHKWMFTNFDCSAYFVKDKEALIKTLEILPEYLKTRSRGGVNDYRDWGIPLGRRFRALKLWFVIRSFGIGGLQEKIRYHISLAQKLHKIIENDTSFEIMAPVPLNTVCFRYRPQQIKNREEINRLNEILLTQINKTGKLYLTHTKLHGNYVIRMVTAQTNVQEDHIVRAWDIIKETANGLID
ncbi:MAG: aminotransferase class V-fold PLP-dependent enzyme [Bacteroidetes bacterium]|nr:aminotransferase class V-fold PLP-dependent enzyme [Bacteroidota bacterium]